jgi:hypothetical protein
MSSPEQDHTPGANDLPDGHETDDSAHERVKRAWTPPTVTTFKVTETQGGRFNFPFDGANNTSSIP